MVGRRTGQYSTRPARTGGFTPAASVVAVLPSIAGCFADHCLVRADPAVDDGGHAVHQHSAFQLRAKPGGWRAGGAVIRVARGLHPESTTRPATRDRPKHLAIGA